MGKNTHISQDPFSIIIEHYLVGNISVKNTDFFIETKESYKLEIEYKKKLNPRRNISLE